MGRVLLRIVALSNLYPPDVLGGYELACSQVVDALRCNGHDVQVLTGVPRLPILGPDAAHVHRRLHLVDDRYWVDLDGGPDDVFAMLRDAGSRFVNAQNVHVLVSALAEFRPDVVYVNNLIGLGGLGLMATLQYLCVPWVWQLGDAVPRDLCTVRRELVPQLAAEFNRSIRGHYVAVSQLLLEEIRGAGFGLDGSVAVIPNWITGRRIDEHPRRNSNADKPLRIMSCGSVSRQKGVDILICAAARLLSAGHGQFAIDVYGRIDDPTLPALARQMGLSNHVAFKGPRNHAEILSRYSEYDVFAFPTREREPFGLVPLEALASGCVPVITRRCGVAEWLVHGVHCLKAARHPQAFAEAFEAIIRGDVELSRLARRGRDLVWNEFHLDSILPRIEAILSAAAREGGTRQTPGKPAAAYRLARLAEAISQNLIQQTWCA